MANEPRPSAQEAEVRDNEGGVTATFKDISDARSAMESLSQAGIEGQHITPGGAAAEEASAEPVSASESKAPDGRLMFRWFSIVAVWSAVGGAIGAVVGIPVGVLMMNDSSLSVIGLSAGLGGLGGSTIAGLVASMTAISAQEQAWELSFHDTDGGEATVSVSSDEPKDVGVAAKVFEKKNSLDVTTKA